ncbi:MAG: hypothetical protein PHQ27_05025, partial [Victivallales bacterium]|nr:hypothetical protein [Victivallales bacterium]
LVILMIGLRKVDSDALVDLFLLLAQAGVPLLFLYLLPPEYLRRDGTPYHWKFNLGFDILVWGLTILAYADLIQRFRHRRKRTPAQLISPLILLAVIAYFLSPPESWPTLIGDDGHNGELALPWYLFEHFRYLPYADYRPCHGLIDYGNGFFTWLFLGDNFSAIPYMSRLTDLLVLAAVWWPFRRLGGNLVALLGLTAMWNFNSNAGGGLMVGCALLLLLTVPRNYRHPVRWLIVYAVGGTAATLFSITDSAIIVVALLPMACYQLITALRQWRRMLWPAIAVALAVAAALYWTPFYRIVFAMMQLVLERSEVYSLAHGVPWTESYEPATAVTTGIFRQLVCFSWLFVSGLAIMRLLFSRRSSHAANIRWLSCAAIAIAAVILTQRTGGTGSNDPAGSPLMSAAMVFVGLLLPYLALPLFRRKPWRMLFLAGWCVWLGLIGHQAIGISRLWTKASTIITEPKFTVDGAAVGIPALGDNLAVAPDHRQYLQHVHAMLQTLLHPGETYLDLTPHGTGYAFFNRRPPLPYVSCNYIVSCRQQKLAVAMLEENPPPLVLIHGRNVNHHNGLLPLRCYGLYRYLLHQYRPFRDVNGLIWLIRRGEEKRLRNQPLIKTESLDDVELWTHCFQDRTIAAYPALWGKSSVKLLAQLCDPINLIHRVRAGRGMICRGDNSFQARPGGGELLIDLPPQADGDFLYIEFDTCIRGHNFKLGWQDEFAGRGRPYLEFRSNSPSYLIPLYDAPNWVLSSQHNQLELSLPPQFQDHFKLHRLELYRRP